MTAKHFDCTGAIPWVLINCTGTYHFHVSLHLTGCTNYLITTNLAMHWSLTGLGDVELYSLLCLCAIAGRRAAASLSALFHSLRLLALPFLATLSFRACCSLKWSSSALRSRPGHAHIRPSNDRRPNTWPLTGNRWIKERYVILLF